MRLTRSQTITIQLLALIFFPGVLVHELGHFLMASILFVPTGEIEFLPKIQEDTIKLGSVAIARTDPFRRFLIGVAPVLSGIGILLLTSYYIQPLWPISWKSFLFAYILFEIGNTMFSSKKDLEGAVGLLLFIGFMALCLYLLGARLPESLVATFVMLSQWSLFLQIAIWLGASCVLNLFLLQLLRLVR